MLAGSGPGPKGPGSQGPRTKGPGTVGPGTKTPGRAHSREARGRSDYCTPLLDSAASTPRGCLYSARQPLLNKAAFTPRGSLYSTKLPLLHEAASTQRGWTPPHAPDPRLFESSSLYQTCRLCSGSFFYSNKQQQCLERPVPNFYGPQQSV